MTDDNPLGGELRFGPGFSLPDVATVPKETKMPKPVPKPIPPERLAELETNNGERGPVPSYEEEAELLRVYRSHLAQTEPDRSGEPSVAKRLREAVARYSSTPLPERHHLTAQWLRDNVCWADIEDLMTWLDRRQTPERTCSSCGHKWTTDTFWCPLCKPAVETSEQPHKRGADLHKAIDDVAAAVHANIARGGGYRGGMMGGGGFGQPSSSGPSNFTPGWELAEAQARIAELEARLAEVRERDAGAGHVIKLAQDDVLKWKAAAEIRQDALLKLESKLVTVTTERDQARENRNMLRRELEAVTSLSRSQLMAARGIDRVNVEKFDAFACVRMLAQDERASRDARARAEKEVDRLMGELTTSRAEVLRLNELPRPLGAMRDEVLVELNIERAKTARLTWEIQTERAKASKAFSFIMLARRCVIETPARVISAMQHMDAAIESLQLAAPKEAPQPEQAKAAEAAAELHESITEANRILGEGKTVETAADAIDMLCVELRATRWGRNRAAKILSDAIRTRQVGGSCGPDPMEAALAELHPARPSGTPNSGARFVESTSSSYIINIYGQGSGGGGEPAVPNVDETCKKEPERFTAQQRETYRRRAEAFDARGGKLCEDCEWTRASARVPDQWGFGCCHKGCVWYVEGLPTFIGGGGGGAWPAHSTHGPIAGSNGSSGGTRCGGGGGASSDPASDPGRAGGGSSGGVTRVVDGADISARAIGHGSSDDSPTGGIGGMAGRPLSVSVGAGGSSAGGSHSVSSPATPCSYCGKREGACYVCRGDLANASVFVCDGQAGHRHHTCLKVSMPAWQTAESGPDVPVATPDAPERLTREELAKWEWNVSHHDRPMTIESGSLKKLLAAAERDLDRAENEQAPKEARATLVLEQTMAALRRVCGRLGCNDWGDDAHPADVIEKYLGRHLRGNR